MTSQHTHSAHDHSAHDHSAPDHSAPDHGAHDHGAHDHSAHDHGAHDHRAHDHSSGPHAHAAPDDAMTSLLDLDGEVLHDYWSAALDYVSEAADGPVDRLLDLGA